jgi:lycopene beta-cyclase
MTLDLLLAGGGLANSLIAYRLASERPEIDLRIIERGATLGGNHTWSFHDGDLEPEQRTWIKPLVGHSWDRHELRFPERRRVMTGGYNSVASDRLHSVVGGALGDRVITDAEIVDVNPTSVALADGRTLSAGAVIDGRGDPGSRRLDICFQKFVGLFVRLGKDCGLDGPILMDATVPQRDGYRFVYTLPFSERDLLVEDTYYSDTPNLDRPFLREGVLDYARRQGWSVDQVTGEEAGVLPIALGGDILGFWEDGPPGVARSGMRAALFHPTTGYSLPEAVRLADEIAASARLDSQRLYDLCRQRSLRLWRRYGYFRLLNRMLFRAAEPERRYRVFQRFYGLSQSLIERFYAGRLGWFDKLRIVTGRPPVPIHRALRCLVWRDPAGLSREATRDTKEARS